MQKLLHFLDPRTKAKRAEYILGFLACLALNFLLTDCLGSFFDDQYSLELIVFIVLASFFTILIIRRLHDTGLSWLWISIMLIPLVNFIFLIVLCFLPPNNFKKTEPSPTPQPAPAPETTTEPEPESESLPLTDLEQSLIDKYSALYQRYKNLTPAEATDLATTLLKEAKQEALSNNTYFLPTNLGDLVLQNTPPSDPKARSVYDLIQERLPGLRNAGVTDQDIKWWWNFSQIERSMIIKNDEAEYSDFFVAQLLKTQTKFPTKESAQNAAIAITNKHLPLYSQGPQDYFFSPDDPLPIELKDRVDAFMDHASRFTDFQQTLQQIQTFSTFNAFVRHQITDKRL